jgi:hypothetical protein
MLKTSVLTRRHFATGNPNSGAKQPTFYIHAHGAGSFDSKTGGFEFSRIRFIWNIAANFPSRPHKVAGLKKAHAITISSSKPLPANIVAPFLFVI